VKGWLGGALAAFAISSAAELWVAVRPPLARVDVEHVRAAADSVRRERARGEVVVHSPLFSPEALRGLGDLAARPDLPPPRFRRGRIWLIDRAGHAMFVPDATKTERARFGEVRVWTAHVAAPEDESDARFDLYRDLGPGLMRVERPPGRVISVCARPRAAGGYGCPGQPEWVYASRYRQTIDGKSRACVWAHPIADATVVFELPAIPEPPQGTLQLHVGAGLSDEAVKTPGGASVRTKIRQEGTPMRTLVVPNRRGWYELDVAVKPNRPIRLLIDTEDDGVRHHCIEASVSVVENEDDR